MSAWPPSFQQLLSLPLVQLLSQPSLPGLVSHDLILTNQRTALQLVQLMPKDGGEQLVHVMVTLSHNSDMTLLLSLTYSLTLQPSPPTIPPPNSSPHYSLLTSTSHTYLQLCHSPPSVTKWLQQVAHELSSSKPSPSGQLAHLALILSALVLREREGKLCRPLLDGLAGVAKSDPAIVGTLHLFAVPCYRQLYSLSPHTHTHTHSHPPSCPSYSTSSPSHPVPIPH